VKKPHPHNNKSRKYTPKINQRSISFQENNKTFALLEQAVDGIFTLDKNGRFLTANATFCKMLGYTLEELYKLNILDTYLKKEKSIGRRRLKEIRKEKILKYERMLRRKNGTTFFAEVTAIKLKNNTLQGIIRDITIRKLAEEKLKIEKDKAQKYLDIANVMLIALDHRGNVSLINKKGCKILGYRENEILNKNWLSTFIPKKYRAGVNDVFHKILAGKIKTIKNFENPILTKNGQERIITWSNSILKNEKGKIIGILSSGEDVTKNKLAEKKLKESEERLRTIFEKNTDAILSVNPRTRRYSFGNKKAVEMLGYSKKEFKNLKIDKLHLKEDLPQVLEQFKKISNGEIALAKNVRIKRKDGSVFYADINGFPFIFSGKKFVIGFFRDVTKHKLIQEKLIESEEKFVKAFQNSPSPMAISTLDEGRYIDVNRSFLETFGFKREEVLGRTYQDIKIFADPGQRKKAIQHVKENKVVRDWEIEFHTRTGKQRIGLFSAESLDTQSGRYLLGTMKDITERKLAEKKNLQLASIVAYSDDAIIGKDLEGRITSWNKGAELMYGYTESEVLGKSIAILAPAEQRNEIEQFLKKIREGKYIKHHETLRQRKDGTFIHVSLTVSSIKDTNGQIIGTSTIARDITERKLAVEVLRQSEERFMKAFQTSPILMSITTIEEGRFVEINNCFLKTLDYKRADVIGKTTQDLDIYVDPEQRNSFVQLVKTQGYARDFEVLIQTRTGDLRIGLFSAEIIELQNKQFLLTVMQDITEVRTAEKALKESEERFRGIAANLPGVVYQFYSRPNGTMGLHYISERSKEILGLDNNPDGFFERFSACIHPDEKDRFFSSIQNAVRSVCKWEFEGRYIKPTGEEIFLRGISQPKQEKDELIFNGMMLDVTDRKKAEIAFEQEKIFSDAIIDAIPGTFWVIDQETNFIKWNRHHEEVFGVSTADFRTRYPSALLVIHEDERERAENMMKEVFLKGWGSAEFRILGKDGIRNFLLTGRRLEIGTSLFIVGVGVDITDQKKLDEAITENADRLFTIIQKIEEGITFSNKEGYFEIFNSKMEEITGYSKEEANTQGDFINLIYKDPAERLKALRGIDEVCKKGLIKDIETIIQTKKGAEKTLSVSTSLVKYKNKDMFLSVYRDISSQKRIEKMKGEFVSVVSHELRTPLSIIKEGICLVLDKSLGNINADQEESLHTAQNNIIRLSHVIDNLLNISKIEAHKEEIIKKPLDITQLIKQIANDFRFVANSKKLKIEIDTPKEPLIANIDSNKIGEVVINLIGNAIKFTEAGTILISLKDNISDIECSVSDTGIGISKENITKVFDKFQQFGRQWGPGEKGTGLGLAISKGIIELHGGRIRVESQIQKGTKITFELPKNINGHRVSETTVS